MNRRVCLMISPHACYMEYGGQCTCMSMIVPFLGRPGPEGEHSPTAVLVQVHQGTMLCMLAAPPCPYPDPQQ